MDRKSVIEYMAIELAVKLCNGEAADAVAKYFELLPQVRQAFAEHKSEGSETTVTERLF